MLLNSCRPYKCETPRHLCKAVICRGLAILYAYSLTADIMISNTDVINDVVILYHEPLSFDIQCSVLQANNIIIYF